MLFSQTWNKKHACSGFSVVFCPFVQVKKKNENITKQEEKREKTKQNKINTPTNNKQTTNRPNKISGLGNAYIL